MRLYRNIILHLVATLISVATYAQSGEITILAHRGGCGEGMENTLGTIRKSLDAGIKAFEIDLRITKDGTIVLQHDDTLKRTAGIERCVEEMTDKEVREIRLNDGSPLMFLDEFLNLMSKQKGLYIEFELKCRKYSESQLFDSGYCDKVAKAVLAAQPKGSTYAITSFDTRALRHIQSHYPTAEIGLITKSGCTKEVVDTALSIGAIRIAAHLDKTSREGVQYAHTKGIKVNLWPGRSDETLLQAWALGADIHCTDYPTRLTKYAKRHIKWLKTK